MTNLLRIDSSINGDASVSRKLTARAAQGWLATNPGGAVTYRDFGQDPLPHLDAAGWSGLMVPADERTDAQAKTYTLGTQLAQEIDAADAIILGLPLYNFGAPSTVKAWVDHLVIPGVTFDAMTQEPRFAGKSMFVLASRGGGYGEGTPRHGWDHAEPWLPKALTLTGIQPKFITAELTLASVNPAMSELIPLAEQSLSDAERQIDELWASAAV